MDQTPKTISVIFIQPWHYSLDGFRTIRASVGEVADLPEAVAASALALQVAKLQAGPSAPMAEATKAAAPEPVSLTQAELVMTETPAAKPARKRSAK